MRLAGAAAYLKSARRERAPSGRRALASALTAFREARTTAQYSIPNFAASGSGNAPSRSSACELLHARRIGDGDQRGRCGRSFSFLPVPKLIASRLEFRHYQFTGYCRHHATVVVCSSSRLGHPNRDRGRSRRVACRARRGSAGDGLPCILAQPQRSTTCPDRGRFFLRCAIQSRLEDLPQ